MSRGVQSVDADVYRHPSPAAVARLVESHGMEAACARWHWLGARTLGAMAQSARAAAGQASVVCRPRSYSELDAAVCVEAAHILGSLTRGERAAELTVANAGRGICQARGLPMPAISPEERGTAARIGHAAARGDAAAIAARDARLQHEFDVGRVLRVALARVPEQPATGRYLLPPLDDALREALADLPAAPVAAVFPDLAPPPAPHPEETLMANAADRPAQPHRRAPEDSVLRADHASGAALLALAENYGISPSSVLSHWNRLRLSARGRLAGYEAAMAARSAARAAAKAEPGPGTEQVPAPEAQAAPEPDPAPPSDRLSLSDLRLAASLLREGVRPEDAVALVRADRAAASGRRAPDRSRADDQVVADWYDALAETGLAETAPARAEAEARYEAAFRALDASTQATQ